MLCWRSFLTDCCTPTHKELRDTSHLPPLCSCSLLQLLFACPPSLHNALPFWLQPPKLVRLHTWFNSAGETMANQPTSTSMTLCGGFLTFIQYPACRMPWDNWLFVDSPTVDNEHTVPSLAVPCCYVVLHCVTCVMLCYTARSLLLCSLLLLFVSQEVDL